MNDIGKIIFYSNKGNEKYHEKTCIIYKDGKRKIVSKDSGIKIVRSMIEKSENTSFEQLQNSGIVLFMHEDEMLNYVNSLDAEKKKEQENVKNYNNMKKQEEKLLKNTEKEWKKPYKQEKRKEHLKGTVWIVTYVVLLGALIYSAKRTMKSVGLFSKPLYENSDYDEASSNNYITSYGRFSKLINLNRTNKNRTLFVKKIWDYLLNYNTDYSNKHIDEKIGSKLSHTWDEVEALLLIYNDYSNSEINMIYGNYPIDNSLYEKYDAAVKQEIYAHVVQNSALGIDKIIFNEAGKQFYLKYENMIIGFNKEKDSEKKINLAKEFYNEVNIDFNSYENTNIESYKLSAVPCIKAMNRLCWDLKEDFVLTDRNTNCYDDYCKNKITKYQSYQKKYVLNKENETDEEVSYYDFRTAAIADLEDLDAYVKDESERSIGNNYEYINNVNWLQNLQTDKKSDLKIEYNDENINEEDTENSEILEEDKDKTEKENKKEVQKEEKIKLQKETKKETTNSKKKKENNQIKEEQNDTGKQEIQEESDSEDLENIDDIEIHEEEIEQESEYNYDAIITSLNDKGINLYNYAYINSEDRKEKVYSKSKICVKIF